MITESLSAQIAEAMKARDSVRLATLKLLSAELHNEWIAKQHELSGDEELLVVRREAKKRKDMIEICDKSGKPEHAETNRQELKILQEFLPEEMGNEELEKIIDEIVAETGAAGIGDLGKVIGAVKAKVGAKAEGGRIAELVKTRLTSQ